MRPWGSWRTQVMRNINAAAAVTPIGLLGVALLASPRRTLVEADLLRQLNLLKALLADCPYSARVTVTDLDGPRRSSPTARK